jgi:SP family myo-inositol transporter-like MFS transporter 13
MKVEYRVLLLSLITFGLNAFGSIVSIFFIDRIGRRKLLIISLLGVILSLGLLSEIFVFYTWNHSPWVTPTVTSQFKNYTCPDYTWAVNANGWNCKKCLMASSPPCGFCALGTNMVNEDFLT